MLIRAARPEDLAPLSRALAPLPLFHRYGLTAQRLEERWTRGLGEHGSLRVAEEAGEPLGLAWFLAQGTFATGAYLRTLAVTPRAQGHGVGARLLATYETETARPSGGYFLLCSDFNLDAQRFYTRHGYQESGRLPDFSIAGITELLFWKPTKTGAAP